jgi:hypothetical protein
MGLQNDLYKQMSEMCAAGYKPENSCEWARIFNINRPDPWWQFWTDMSVWWGEVLKIQVNPNPIGGMIMTGFMAVMVLSFIVGACQVLGAISGWISRRY